MVESSFVLGRSLATRSNAAVLVDLENFYLGRESRQLSMDVRGPYDFAADLDYLTTFTDEIAAGRRRVVRRAYADFNASRASTEGPRRDYYLQKVPELLMDQGIEPVQVFRFPGAGDKNAVDMRMAMDAATLMARGNIELFILVTGDADFIPVILELKQLGAHVAVIGVNGSTSRTMQRYCDQFEYFEDLVAARDAAADMPTGLGDIAAALRRVLAHRSPIVFAAIKPLLSRELEAPFDPARYGCDDTGEFLRTFADELAIRLHREKHDWVVEAADGEPAVEAETSDYTLRPRAPHLYSRLLQHGTPHLHLPPGPDWRAITETLYELALDEEGRPRPVLHTDLVERAATRCAAEIDDAERKVKAVAFVVFKAGCFVCRDGSPQDGRSDFHWSRSAVLAAGVTDLNSLREQARLFVIRTLMHRLRSAGYAVELDEQRLATELEGTATPAATELEAIQRLARRAAESV